MQPEISKHLYDIMASIGSIEEFVSQTPNFSEFKTNRLVKRAIEREFSIIGEAVNRIKKAIPDIELENARKIIDLRNLIVHGYDKVDDAIIWGVIKKHLPKLKVQVSNLMK
ncbi:MAG: DUF86 domain-containing protein [bacterium]